MLVYGSSISPFVRKVLVFAAEKGVAIKAKGVGIGSDDPGFNAVSPFRKMPALADGDFGLSDSSAIVHYIEAKHPHPALIPAEAQARGKVIWWDEFADTILAAAVGKMFFNRVVGPKFVGIPGDQDAADTAERDEVPPILDYLERSIPASGFLVGDALTLADISVAASYANLGHAGFVPDAARWPKIAAWSAAMFARPSFAAQLERDARVLG